MSRRRRSWRRRACASSTLTRGLADRTAHGEIAHQRAGVAALVRRERRQEHEHVRADAAAPRAALTLRAPRDRRRGSRAPGVDAGGRASLEQADAQEARRLPRRPPGDGFLRTIMGVRQRHFGAAPRTKMFETRGSRAARSNIEKGSTTTRPRSRPAMSVARARGTAATGS